MTKRMVSILLLAVVATAAGCAEDVVATCPADAPRVRMSPRSQSVPLGTSYQPVARVFVCGGGREIPFVGVWRSRDTTVARVDSAGGRVSARGRGVTYVWAQYFGMLVSNPNGGTWDSIQITVP